MGPNLLYSKSKLVYRWVLVRKVQVIFSKQIKPIICSFRANSDQECCGFLSNKPENEHSHDIRRPGRHRR